MTQNEQIAKVMGWSHIEREFYPKDNPTVVIECDSLEFAAALEQRMVEDGWDIIKWHFKDGHMARAVKNDAEKRQYHDTTDNINGEPAAIRELFCRVYGITSGE